MSTKIRNLSIEKDTADDADYFIGDDPSNGVTYKITKHNLFSGLASGVADNSLLTTNNIVVANYQTDLVDAKGHPFTAVGSPSISNSKSPYSSGSSLYLPGGSYVQYNANTDFRLNADWAIEFFTWIPSTYATNDIDLPLLSIDAPFNIFFQKTRSGYNNNGVFNQTAALGINSSITVVCNSKTATIFDQWNHLAAVKTGNVLYYFVNGVHQNSSMYSSLPNTITNPTIYVGNISGYTLPTGVYFAGLRIQSTIYRVPTLPFTV
ncbi:LamG-like jellyroll fold domain-containing protein [Nostoc sp. C117]|uniref:LamG-like jellyroll fold domain-containing protein n=1 Tax=Nostoc sp. C117 TaxID=3349875 RepID=UPI00370D5099